MRRGDTVEVAGIKAQDGSDHEDIHHAYARYASFPFPFSLEADKRKDSGPCDGFGAVIGNVDDGRCYPSRGD